MFGLGWVTKHLLSYMVALYIGASYSGLYGNPLSQPATYLLFLAFYYFVYMRIWGILPKWCMRIFKKYNFLWDLTNYDSYVSLLIHMFSVIEVLTYQQFPIGRSFGKANR
jgi:hypothetical protein